MLPQVIALAFIYLFVGRERDARELEKDFIDKFAQLGAKGEYERAVLSTCAGGRVTSRKMRFIADGLTLYCYAIRGQRKYEQIAENPNVAVNLDYIQVEGTATLEGHPLDEKNSGFLKVFMKTQPDAFEEYNNNFRNTEIDVALVKIKPSKVSLLGVVDGESCINILNVKMGKAYRVYDYVRVEKDHGDAPAYWE
jgi:hypothetical protein